MEYIFLGKKYTYIAFYQWQLLKLQIAYQICFQLLLKPERDPSIFSYFKNFSDRHFYKPMFQGYLEFQRFLMKTAGISVIAISVLMISSLYICIYII